MHKSTVTFVHPTIGEYAAGRYLASLDLSLIQTLVRNKHNDPRWRESLLFASGLGVTDPIVATLLDIDATTNINVTALFLAVAVLAEAKVCPPTLASTVIERIKICLTSSSPGMAYEAAEHTSNLAAQAPELVYSSFYPLLQHAQKWTRISAMYLLLVGDKGSVDLNILEQILDDLLQEDLQDQEEEKTPIEISGDTTTATIREAFLFTSDGWGVQNNVIVLGAAVLAQVRPNEATKSLLQRLYVGASISLETRGKLADLLIELGCQEFVEENTSGFSSKTLINWFKITLMADLKMLETILEVTKVSFMVPDKPRKLLYLHKLIYALNVPNSGIGDWDILRRLDDIQSIKAVLLGFIQAYALPIKELALDTIWALNEIKIAINDNLWIDSLLHILPHIPIKLNDPVRATINVPIEDLIRALKHPSGIIARGALYILLLSKQKEELRTLLKNQDAKILQIVEDFAG